MHDSRRLSFLSWCLFDFANNAFPTLVITFIFSTYFVSHVANSKIEGTSLWGFTISLSGVLVAVLAPLVGAVIDQHQAKKKPLFFFWVINLVACGLLFWVKPQAGDIIFALILVLIANWSYEQSQVLYNGFLMNIAPKDKIGRYSGWGWAAGYVGGLLALVVAFVMVKTTRLSHDPIFNVRATALFVVIWTALFSWPLFCFTQDYRSSGKPWRQSIAQSAGQLFATLKTLRKTPKLLQLFIARLFYIDALNTLFAFGGIYAATEFGFSMEQILLFAIILNITAGLGAALLAFLDDYLGSKLTICISLLGLIGFLVGLLLIHRPLLFWVIAPGLGIFVGPVQAASRSYLTRLSDSQTLNRHFGLYALTGRITAFIGPALVSAVTVITHSLRLGMVPVLLFFILGFCILIWPIGRSTKAPLKS